MIELYSINPDEQLMLVRDSHWQRDIVRGSLDINVAKYLQLFQPDWLVSEGLVSETASGRGMVYFFEAMDEKCVLRHYFRGGMVARLTDDSFVFTGMQKTRPYRELSMLCKLFNAGLNVPKPLAAKIQRKGLSYSADIITGAIEESQELHQLLMQTSLDKPIWLEIGKTIKLLHNAQVCHTDLNVKNLLLQANMNSKELDKIGMTKVFILDFDGCKERKGENWKIENLARFRRSLDKQCNKQDQYFFSEENWHWFTQGYQSA